MSISLPQKIATISICICGLGVLAYLMLSFLSSVNPDIKEGTTSYMTGEVITKSGIPVEQTTPKTYSDIYIPSDIQFPLNINAISPVRYMYWTLAQAPSEDDVDILYGYLRALFLDRWTLYAGRNEFIACIKDTSYALPANESPILGGFKYACARPIPPDKIFDETSLDLNMRYRIGIFYQAYISRSDNICGDILNVTFLNKSARDNAAHKFKNMVLCQSMTTGNPEDIKISYHKMLYILEHRRCDLYDGRLQELCKSVE